MAFTEAFEIDLGTDFDVEFSEADYINSSGTSFSPGFEVDYGTEFDVAFAESNYTNSGGRVFTPNNFEIDLGTDFDVEFSEANYISDTEPIKAFSYGKEVTVYERVYLPSDTGVEIVFDEILNPVATRAGILPDATGRISHLRIMANSRIEQRAREMHEIMKGLI